MKINGGLQFIGDGTIANAALENLAVAPTRSGAIALVDGTFAYVNALGELVKVASKSEVADLVDAVNSKLDVTTGGTITGATNFTGSAIFAGGASFTDAATISVLPNTANSIVNKSYVDNLFESGIEWLEPVKTFTDTFSMTLVEGDRVIFKTDGKIYTYAGGELTGVAPGVGNSVFVVDLNAGYRFDGTSWVRFTGTGSQTAGDGLTITGNVLNVVGDNTMNISADSIGVKVGSHFKVDTNGIHLDGGFLSTLLLNTGGAVTGNISSSATPTDGTHLVTKDYVDGQIASLATFRKVYVSSHAETTATVANTKGSTALLVQVLSSTGEVILPDSIVITETEITVTLAQADTIQVFVMG